MLVCEGFENVKTKFNHPITLAVSGSYSLDRGLPPWSGRTHTHTGRH
jgi:hypothetical protein